MFSDEVEDWDSEDNGIDSNSDLNDEEINTLHIDGRFIRHIFGGNLNKSEVFNRVKYCLEHDLIKAEPVINDDSDETSLEVLEECHNFRWSNNVIPRKVPENLESYYEVISKNYIYRNCEGEKKSLGYEIVGPFITYDSGVKRFCFTTFNRPNFEECIKNLDILCLWDYCFILSQYRPFMSYACPLIGNECVNSNGLLCGATREKSNKLIRNTEKMRKHIFKRHLGMIHLCYENRCNQIFYKRNDLEKHYIYHHGLSEKAAKYMTKACWNSYAAHLFGNSQAHNIPIEMLIQKHKQNLFERTSLPEIRLSSSSDSSDENDCCD